MPHRSLHALVRTIPLVAATLAGLPAPSAFAARPAVSDAADAREKGSCEFEAAGLRLSERGSPRVHGSDFSLGCGLFDRTELVTGYARASGGGISVHGASLGGKTNLVEVKPGQTGIGLAYAIAAVKAPGSGWRRDATSLVGLATRELRPGLLGHANFGWSRSHGERRDRAVWSLGLETTSTLVFTADVFGESGSRPTLSAGVGYSLVPGWSVNLALARSLQAPRGNELSMGLRAEF